VYLTRLKNVMQKDRWVADLRLWNPVKESLNLQDRLVRWMEVGSPLLALERIQVLESSNFEQLASPALRRAEPQVVSEVGPCLTSMVLRSLFEHLFDRPPGLQDLDHAVKSSPQR